MLLPKEAPWLAEFEDELLAFPSGKHDDQVDSVSQFLKWAWNNVHRPRNPIVAPEVFGLEEGPWPS